MPHAEPTSGCRHGLPTRTSFSMRFSVKVCAVLPPIPAARYTAARTQAVPLTARPRLLKSIHVGFGFRLLLYGFSLDPTPHFGNIVVHLPDRTRERLGFPVWSRRRYLYRLDRHRGHRRG